MSVQALSVRLWREVSGYGLAVRRFRRNPRLYLLCVLIFGSALNLIGLLLNLYLLQLGYSEIFVGQAVSANYIGLMLGGVPAGMVYNRWGARRAYSLSVMVTGLAWAGLALARAPFLLLAASWLGGLGNALMFTTTYPFLSEDSGEAERPYLFGANAIAWTVAETLGSFFGGLLPGLLQGALALPTVAAGQRAAIVAAVVLAGIGLLPILAMQPGRRQGIEATPLAPTTSPPRGDRGAFIGAAVAVFFLSLTIGLSFPFFNVYFSQYHHATDQQIGVIVASSRLLSLATFFLMPILMQRFGHVRLIVVCGLAAVPFYILLGMPFPLGAAIGVLYGAMLFCRFAIFVLFILTVEAVPPRLRGQQSSLRVIANALSLSIAGLLAGWLITRLGYGWLFGLAAAASAVASAATWFFFRHNPLVSRRHGSSL